MHVILAQGFLKSPCHTDLQNNHLQGETLSWWIPLYPKLATCLSTHLILPSLIFCTHGSKMLPQATLREVCYKPSLVPTVLSTERRSNCFLSDPTSSVQQGSCTHGASKSGICRAAVLLLCEIKLELEISIDLMNHRPNYNFSFKKHTKSKAWSMAWVRIKYLQLQMEERWGDQGNWKGSHTCFLNIYHLHLNLVWKH